MQKTSKGMRLHIGIYGRRNVGKSSILNALVKQRVAIVSEVAGTTTDPVEKPMEVQPLGPVLFIDTAGVDDTGGVGSLRVEATRRCFDRTDIALIVAAEQGWGHFEDELCKEFGRRKVPYIAVFNKVDIHAPALTGKDNAALLTKSIVSVSAVTGAGIDLLRNSLISNAPGDFLASLPLIGDLVAPGEIVILVVPIDKEAPAGRLILPQVQTIRDLLDTDACCIVCKERELSTALGSLNKLPRLVVTDSQAFLKVAADTPDSVMMTSFSILFARYKGDLPGQVADTMKIDKLKGGDRILIAEACTHHPVTDDIGRVKIPRWLTQYTGLALDFCTVQGHDFPPDLSSYSLVIHCGSCMHNRREMLSRILRCREVGVPITNYGLAIAYTLGIFERALKPFPGALETYKTAKEQLGISRRGI